jgi:hypothetical protein
MFVLVTFEMRKICPSFFYELAFIAGKNIWQYN